MSKLLVQTAREEDDIISQRVDKEIRSERGTVDRAEATEASAILSGEYPARGVCFMTFVTCLVLTSNGSSKLWE